MIDYIKLIINQFGGKEDVLIILFFFISFFLINSLIKNNKLRLTISLLLGAFLLLQIASLYFTQSFIGYQFFIHFNLRGTQGLTGLFIPQIILAVVLLVLITSIFYFSHIYFYQKFNSRFTIKKNYSNVVIVFFIALFSLVALSQGSFVTDSKTLVSIFNTNEVAFKEILKKNGMTDYISPNQIESEKGKNIIIISLESIEKGFLNEKFSDLSPNLQSLKKDWNYYDLRQNNGSEWTSGSLYTYLTGFPSYFGIHGNNIFKTAYHSEISSISHVLEKAGYTSIYLNGNTDFSGTKEMLNAFNFNKIIDYKNVEVTGNESVYGIRDKDLFELAKQEVELQIDNKQPFAMFLSTTDTHYPDGIYDERMESVVSTKNSDLEFMVASVDYMVGDFIAYLKEKGLLENTTIYIFPDHLKMGDPSIFKETGKRSLYLITNAEKEATTIDTLQNFYQIDLPKIILEGADIKHNLKFLSDYITGDKNTYIKNNILNITEINTNGLLRIDSKPFDLEDISPKYAEYKKDTLRYIAHAGGKIEKHTYTNSKEALDLNYKKGFRLFELDIIKTKDGKYVAAHDWKHWSTITKFKGAVPVNNQQFLEQKLHGKYTPLDIDGINEWFSTHNDAILVTDKVNDPIAFSKQFVDPNRLIMELFDINAVKEGLKANIRSAMPTQKIIRDLSNEEIKNLSDLGVKNIAISRRFIEKNKELLNEFKKNGIMPYAFHVNFDAGFDEDFVTKYEMDYIYGIYADEWSFE